MNEKRWRQLGGGSFFKFEDPGQVLEGIWRGTKAGRYGDNGVVEVFGDNKMFTLNTALKDLMRVKPGCDVRIEYLGKQTAKNGNEFKAFSVQVAEDAVVEEEEHGGGDEAPF